jgi:hypothetical protein
MKRGLFYSFIILVVMAGSFVSAGPVDDIGKVIDGIVEIVEPITENIIGSTPGGEFLFAKFWILLIVFAIVWVVLSRLQFFSEHNWALVVVSVGVAILSTRFLDTAGTVSAILLPYSTFGIAVAAGLPFILYFLIVDIGLGGPGRALIRRLAWIFFAVIFIGLWFTRYDELVGGVAKSIYPLTALAAIVMMFLDGTINRVFVQLQVEKAGVENKEELIMELKRKIAQAADDLKAGIMSEKQYNSRVEKYKKRIAALNK